LKEILPHLFLCAWLIGCSRAPDDGSTLLLALETSPNKLDPAFVIDVAEGQICSMIFQGLVRFAPSGDLLPDAASTWDVLDGGRRYVFHLDTRMRFSNGRPVRSSDVVYSFERVLSAESRSPRQWVLERVSGGKAYAEGRETSISGLATPDDSTVIIELDKSFRPFIRLLAMPAARIVPREAVEAAGEGFSVAPIGSGAWVLERWERGDYLSFIPNAYHPGASRTLGDIRIRIIPEAFTRIAEFEAGKLDVLEIPLAEIDRFLRDDRWRSRVQSRPDLRVVYIGLNNRKGPLRDVRVRKALNIAVDVDRIIHVLTAGRGIRAGGAIAPTLDGYRGRPSYPYDTGAAMRLLREAGFGDGFTMEIWQRESPEGNRLVEAVQGYLREIGVEVRIVKREWSAFKEAVNQGRVDAYFLDWYADYPDAENFLYPLFHSANAGGGGNRAFIADDRIDRLIEEAQETMDESACFDLYARIDSLVYDRAPWIYLYFPTSFVVVSSRVEGYHFPVLYLGEDYSTVRKMSNRRS
jgi:peptide/nickel transport system substrate-binding protein/oligopeptide transport system substrate-binding protein